MAFPNKIPAKCVICDTKIEVGKGWTEGPPWKSKCQPCSGRAAVDPKAKAVITVGLGIGKVKGKAVFQPRGFLGGDKFSVYRTCCEGTLFNPSLKANVATPDKAVKIIARLKEASFNVEVDPKLSASLQALTAQTKLDVKGADERAVKADEELQARGLHLFPFQRSGV